MKVIVTGGRDYKNQEHVTKALESVGATIVVHGGANGADSHADKYSEWAALNLGIYVETIVYKADWDKYGKAAGPIRNRKMLMENKDAIVLAFSGGQGTNGCVMIARELGMMVFRVEE